MKKNKMPLYNFISCGKNFICNCLSMFLDEDYCSCSCNMFCSTMQCIFDSNCSNVVNVYFFSKRLVLIKKTHISDIKKFLLCMRLLFSKKNVINCFTMHSAVFAGVCKWL